MGMLNGQPQGGTSSMKNPMDVFNVMMDPYHGLDPDQVKTLRKQAFRDTALQGGLSMLSQGYSAEPQPMLGGVADVLSAFPNQLTATSLRMRRGGFGGPQMSPPAPMAPTPGATPQMQPQPVPPQQPPNNILSQFPGLQYLLP